jgi:hypothetical protein
MVRNGAQGVNELPIVAPTSVAVRAEYHPSPPPFEDP